MFVQVNIGLSGPAGLLSDGQADQFTREVVLALAAHTAVSDNGSPRTEVHHGTGYWRSDDGTVVEEPSVHVSRYGVRSVEHTALREALDTIRTRHSQDAIGLVIAADNLIS